jgi:signal transduction histidine kinase
MASHRPARRRRLPGISLPVAVLAALAIVNAIAVASIVTAQRSARLEAESELQREVDVVARSIETRLADLRTDLLFLAHSPALAAALVRIESPDPTTARWSRLDLEGTMLLFMQAQPSIQSLTLAGRAGEPIVQVSRRGGFPLLTPPQARTTDSTQGNRASFPVAAPAPPGAAVSATLRPDALLAPARSEGSGRLSLLTRPEPQAPTARLMATAPVRAEGWEPPVAWQLVGSEERSVLVASIERLTHRFRTTVALNVAIVVLTLLAGWLLLRQSRQAERLAAEGRHQETLRLLERRLAHSEKLASLGRMAAGLAHEINNPLEGMSNYLGILQSDLELGDVEAARQRVPKVREGLERAAGVLRRVLAHSRPTDRSRAAEVDLAALVAETVEFARGLKDLEGVSLRYSPRAAPAPVRGDAGELGQLVLNLVMNAGQVQGSGGEIDVDLERVGDAVLLRVADRGPGIDPRMGRRLFEPFRSTRGSSGLGLSICRSIAEAHSGTIRAVNRPGGGSVFEVSLPPVAAPVAERSGAARGDGAKTTTSDDPGDPV